MTYVPNPDRYSKMTYHHCGNSGLKLPAISLGLWHNFGHDTPHQTKRDICQVAFDNGITHFDLANNYGPPAGSAEEAFGEILKTDFAGYRDELVISSKAGYLMWDGRCCTDALELGTRATRDGIQAVRSKRGRPSPVIRFRTCTPILASVF